MKTVICLLALLCPILSMCQRLTITGQVHNTQGQPISHATVTLLRTGQSTQTNSSGRFNFTNTYTTDSLRISAVGYITATVTNNQRGLLTIQLQQQVTELDETVVIAYGQTTRRLNTGNVGRVTAAEIERQPISNPLAALAGRVPGLVVTQSSGVPGSTFRIEIRGRTILDASVSRNDPLVVIDGVPFESGNMPVSQLSNAANNPFTSSGSLPTGLSPLQSIDPSSIESIEVLKDADATAIYGSRGANGVILITTKKASTDKTIMQANIQTGFSRVAGGVNMLHTRQYLDMRYEAFANDGTNMTTANAPDLLLWDTTRYTNLPALLTGNTARATDVNFSMNGGNAATRFSLGGSYRKETNVFPGNHADIRGAVRLNLQHAPANKKLSTQLSVIYAADRNKMLTADLSQYLILPPHIQLFTADERLNWQSGGTNFSSLGFNNPLSDLGRQYTARLQNLSVNLMLNYKLLRGLTARVSAGYNSFATNEISIRPKTSMAPENSTLASSSFADAKRNNWIIEPQLEYTTLIFKGKLTWLTGATLQERYAERFVVNATGYTNDLLLKSMAAAGALTVANNNETYKYTALFTRLNYNWNEKYIINLSARRDGSSRFGDGKQFANFGAAGLAWLFSNEKWWQPLTTVISFGKLRGSYGITGNDQIGDYKYLNLWSSSFNAYAGIPALRPVSMYNPEFNWEKNVKKEAALELGFLKDRIQLSAAYFLQESANQLVNYRLPSQTGFNSVVKNLPALVRNSGWEFLVQGTILHNKQFDWKASFNMTIPKNRLVSFPGLKTSSYNAFYEEGKSLTVIKKMKYTGVDPNTGLYSYEDFDGNGVISTSGDIQVLGDLDPKMYGGVGTSLRYGRFMFDVFFEYRNQVGANYLSSQYNTPAGFMRNQPVWVLDRWQQTGDNTSFQRYGTGTASQVYQPSSRLSASDAIYSNASFIRFKNLSLSYQLPDVILKKTGISNARFFILCQNLATITNFKGTDPETQSFFQLPPLRTIVGGFQLTF